MNSRSFFLPLVLSLASVACSSAETPSNGSTADGGSQPQPACGLATYPPDFPSSCQVTLDAACCDEERACANDADCVKLIACINACPAPRADACVNACGGDAGLPPGYAAFNGIGLCTKRPSYQAPSTCDWPN